MHQVSLQDFEGYIELMKKRTQAETPTPEVSTFHIVWLPEAGEPILLKYDELPALVESLRKFVSQRGRIFIFEGDRLHITKGQLKFLVRGGEKLPLFQDLTPEIDESGILNESLPQDESPE